MNWAFVDYENIGTLEGLNISDFERIFVFCGPKNTKIKIGSLPSDGFCKIEFIGINTTGSNNLDFHLAFYLGRFHEVADNEICFNVVSNDAGYNGIVNHLKKIGRTCKKVEIAPPKPKLTPDLVLSEAASMVKSRLKQLDGRKRPRKKSKFLNWIKSQCQGLNNGAQPEAVCKELVSAKLVRENGTDISYDLDRKLK